MKSETTFTSQHCCTPIRIENFQLTNNTEMKELNNNNNRNSHNNHNHNNNNNKGQNTLAIDGIAANWGFPTPNLLFPGWDLGTCLTQCYFGPHECPCQMASHSV